jgi:hypothetical protein
VASYCGGRGKAHAEDLRADEYLSALGKDEVAALEYFKLIARSGIPRAEFRDSVVLR